MPVAKSLHFVDDVSLCRQEMMDIKSKPSENKSFKITEVDEKNMLLWKVLIVPVGQVVLLFAAGKFLSFW